MTTTDLYRFSDSSRWDGVYEVVECRRALSPSALPDIDYALNPYGGCEHGCVYCYAPEVTHTQWKDWRVVRVKANITDRLTRELPGIAGTVGIGTVTDPYQGAEARFCLTQQCLGILRSRDVRIHLHTKSDLVLRDIGLLSSMRGEVAVTITTLAERISKMTEPGAPLPRRRLEALRELTRAGIDTYALVGPVLDHLEGEEGRFVEALASTGVRRLLLDTLNSRPLLAGRLSRMGIGGSAAARERIRSLAEAQGMDVRDVFSGKR
jgi:DNA repair photolyase